MDGKKCRICGSFAINPGRDNRPEYKEYIDNDLCDVCFWRTRFYDLQKKISDIIKNTTQ